MAKEVPGPVGTPPYRDDAIRGGATGEDAGSMWRCSGTHWIKVAAAWACFAALVLHLPLGHADERARVKAVRAQSVTDASAAELTRMDVRQAVTETRTPFDLASANLSSFGDAE
ncbi:MAG: hypothetical protein WC807_10245 [Hyphomicrobium sp.]|jgi:hypothetical protein